MTSNSQPRRSRPHSAGLGWSREASSPVLAREKSSPCLGRVVPRGMNGARTSISARKSLMRWSPSLFACRAPSSLVPATFTSLSTATARTRRRICDVDSFWPLARRYLGHPLVAPPLPRPCYVPGRRHLQANQHARQLHWLLSSQPDICVAVRMRLDIDVGYFIHLWRLLYYDRLPKIYSLQQRRLDAEKRDPRDMVSPLQ